MPQRSRTLIYKRTHCGDPDSDGVFGLENCMGRVRGYEFDAVIGIGGHGAEARSNDIAGKITWVGIGAHKNHHPKHTCPIITFDHFSLFDTDGRLLYEIAPNLAKHMGRCRYRFSDSCNEIMRNEISLILEMALKSDRAINKPLPLSGGHSTNCRKDKLCDR